MRNILKILDNNKVSQAKYLPILGQILRTIGKNTVSIKLLEQELQKWSIEKKRTSKFYRNHNGILTHKANDKPTTAFKFYIDFLRELKLIIKTNDFVRCSKYGFVFNALNDELYDNQDFPEFEKVFYLFYLFNNDADTLLLILDYLTEYEKPVHQNIIAKNYKQLLKIRLEHKFLRTNNPEIRDKYLSLVKPKKESQTISKRIIPPRIEWLNDLGIIKETQKDTYTLTNQGKCFFDTIPKQDIKLNKLSEINNKWINNNFFKSISCLFKEKQPYKTNNIDINILLGKYFRLSYKKLNTDSVARISTLPVFIFVSIMLFVKHNLIINFSEMENKLLSGIIVDNKIFTLREAARINESYILINLK